MPENIAENYKQWSTYPNFAKSYDLVYEQMEKAGSALKLSESVLMNAKEGVLFTTE